MLRIDRARLLPRPGAVPRCLCLSLALVPLLMGFRPASDQTIGSAQEEGLAGRADLVQGLVEELHALKQERADLEQSLREQQAQLDTDIQRLRDDLEIAAVRAEARQSIALGNIARVQAANTLVQRIDDFVNHLATDARAICKRLESAITTGVSFLRADRSTRLAAIAGELDSASDDRAEDRARGLVELMDLFVEELRLAETIEERGEQVTLPDNRRIHAYVVRLGLLGEAFVSEDGELVGLSTSTGSWRIELSPRERSAVQELVATARGRRAARLVMIPIEAGEL